MRYNAEEQLQKVMQRKGMYQSRKSRHLSECLAVAAVCLVIGFAAVLSGFSASEASNVADSAYGAFLLSSNSGSYVLCGVVAFVCGCVITLLCVRSRQRQDAGKPEEIKEIERSHTL